MLTLPPRPPLGRALKPLAVCVALACLALRAGAAEEAGKPAPVAAGGPAAAVPVPRPTGAADLVERLDAVSGRLTEINDYLRKPAPDLAGIAVALPGKASEAESVLGRGQATDVSGSEAVELAAIRQKLRSLDRIFVKWRGRLKAEVELLDPWREQLKSDAGFLRDVADPAGPYADEVPPDLLSSTMRSRMVDLASGLEATRKPLLKRLDVVLGADVRVGELQTALRDLQSQLDAARLDRQEQPLAITGAPLWKMPPTLRPPVDLARQNLGVLAAGVMDFIDAQPGQITAFVLILIALFVAISRLRRSILARGETATDELLTHFPYTVILLVWVTIGPVLLMSEMPLGFTLLRGLLAIALLWRILPVLVAPEEIQSMRGLLLLAAAFLAQLVLLGDSWYGRVATVVLGLLSLLVFRSLARRSAGETGGRELFRRAIHATAVVAPFAIVVGLVAEVAGAEALGQQAIGGIVFVTLALSTLLAADIILRSLLDAWVRGPGGRWSRSVRNAPGAVLLWGGRVIRVFLVVAFVNLLPSILPVLEPAWSWIGKLLGTPITAGNLNLSLGNLLAFLVAIALALGAARFVRFILDEDVLSRMPLAPGAAAAASRLIYYVLVAAGILFALAASGVELSRLTLVVSALGVGIGFGLQNVVNNFVSGLILSFERPVREGDQITLGQTNGRVEMIGLRATRIRTFDGAEVIVPNANLISGELTNWTLSDRSRRIEINVGVDYQSDPARVQEVLLKSIADLPGLARHPLPTTAFRAFGASSLDFSLLLWTDDVDDRLAVESAARIQVLNALRAAGIGIPFPRLDVRLQEKEPGAVSPAGSR